MVATPTATTGLQVAADYVVADINQADFGRKELDLSLIHISEPTRPY